LQCLDREVCADGHGLRPTPNTGLMGKLRAAWGALSAMMLAMDYSHAEYVDDRLRYLEQEVARLKAAAEQDRMS
jgi:hypothetical protein